jgi:hypothetical protein
MWVCRILLGGTTGLKKTSLPTLMPSHLRNMFVLVGTTIEALNATMFQFSLNNASEHMK